MTLQVKLLRHDSRLPTRATDGSAGYDLYADRVEFRGDGVVVYHLGVAFKIPEGYAGLLLPRSSIRDRGQVVCNSIGLIDSDYVGEVALTTVRTDPATWQPYHVGERCAQIVFIELPLLRLQEVDHLPTTERGTGGFGSTGHR